MYRKASLVQDDPLARSWAVFLSQPLGMGDPELFGVSGMHLGYQSSLYLY